MPAMKYVVDLGDSVDPGAPEPAGTRRDILSDAGGVEMCAPRAITLPMPRALP